MERTQQVVVADKPNWEGWTEMTVISRDLHGQINSKTVIRSKDGTNFLDVAIEEYTGLTRRMKYSTVRLEDEAARALHGMLSARFGNGN
ncbi:hypothetical protein [Paraburkholderia humisilvae]|uniref:Uncharacterized protein n=1 Tax=Paraburkholderia humisilvae TaxID=627669 RepID=A0A6J5DIA2_9BURK|nr:hypothetical protein [Paraburkholderia humisilvae]CAB3753970.1 hypothetical protein LMG29542_02206 [Paraburkholderia humisilvae]